MIVFCQSNEAFEDSLSENQVYPILQLQNGSVLICNDRDEECWYGLGRFTIRPAASE